VRQQAFVLETANNDGRRDSQVLREGFYITESQLSKAALVLSWDQNTRCEMVRLFFESEPSGTALGVRRPSRLLNKKVSLAMKQNVTCFMKERKPENILPAMTKT
jgi:hypothetical protein